APYGPRPIDEIRDFAFQIMDLMTGQGGSGGIAGPKSPDSERQSLRSPRDNQVKALVIACNAMTAAAYEEARVRYDVPIIGVIEPGVRAGIRSTHNRKVGVLGTKATIESGAYQRALQSLGEDIEIHTQICHAFVEKVEAGDTFSEELISLAENYLAPLLESEVDSVILGCTHYPLLKGVLHWVTKGEVFLISSAEEVAKDVYAELVERGLLRKTKEVGSRRFIVSGDAEQFRKVGSRFLPGIDNVESFPLPGAKLGVRELR
ncbi:MAG: glutamate racemase, partial [Acidimicrobiia bacterium]